jgi:hypothetical protein
VSLLGIALPLPQTFGNAVLHRNRNKATNVINEAFTSLNGALSLLKLFCLAADRRDNYSSVNELFTLNYLSSGRVVARRRKNTRKNISKYTDNKSLIG